MIYKIYMLQWRWAHMNRMAVDYYPTYENAQKQADEVIRKGGTAYISELVSRNGEAYQNAPGYQF